VDFQNPPKRIATIAKLAALTKWEDYVMKIVGQKAIAA
jgi:hypothetical protein